MTRTQFPEKGNFEGERGAPRTMGPLDSVLWRQARRDVFVRGGGYKFVRTSCSLVVKVMRKILT